MKTSSQLKATAKKSLKGRYVQAIGAAILAAIVSIVPFCSPAISVGYSKYNLKIIRGEDTTVSNVFDGFSIFGRALWLKIMVGVFIWLWSLLFLVPGIVKTFSYSMSAYFLADNPQMTASEALLASRKVMDGKKGGLFYMQLSFIGWCLLGSFTFGIAYIWVLPYIAATMAAFYDNAISVNLQDNAVLGSISQ